MEKCSMSPKLLRVSDDVRVARCLRGHCALSSLGDGCSHGPESARPPAQQLHTREWPYREIDAAVVDNCCVETWSTEVQVRRQAGAGYPASRKAWMDGWIVAWV